MVAGFLTLFVGLRGYRTVVAKKYLVIDRELAEITKSSEKEETEVSIPDHYKFNFWTYDLWILIIVFILYMCIEGPEHWYADYV